MSPIKAFSCCDCVVYLIQNVSYQDECHYCKWVSYCLVVFLYFLLWALCSHYVTIFVWFSSTCLGDDI